MLDTISSDINAALKAGDKPTVEALRLLKSALTYARIAARHELSDEEVVKVIRKEMKSRTEAAELYRQNGRAEQADKEEFEYATYEKYVPAQLSVAAIDALVSEQAASLGAEATFAQLMPKVMQACAGKADGKLVAERVTAFINGAK